MSTGIPHPLSEQTKTCLRRFQAVENVLRQSNGGDAILSVLLFSDELDRFKMWASNIGAIYDPSRRDASLDLRLVNAPGIADQVLEFLHSLGKELDGVWQIASGQRENRVGTLETYEEPDDEDEVESPVEVEIEDLSEIHELFQTAQDTVSCLFRLSIAIRKATSRDPYTKSARKRDDPYDEFFDIAHVGHKFPKILGTPWLEKRLGRAITRRRESIRYSKEHSRKLGKNTERTLKEEPAIVHIEQNLVQDRPVILQKPATPSHQSQSTLDSTEASTFDPGTLRIGEEDVEEEASESSYASTEITAEGEGALKVPPIPEQGENGKEFVCPYCWTAMYFVGKKRRKHWKKHVLRDLRPYVCTFPACDKIMFPDFDLWFDHELENHRVQYSCHQCSGKLLDSAEAFEMHWRREHEPSVEHIRLLSLLRTSQQPVTTIRPSLCPFCDPEVADENLPLDAFSFKIHVAKHMRQLALFALPRSSDVGDESWSSGKAALITPDIKDAIDAESALPIVEPDDLPIHIAAYNGWGVEVKRLLQDGQDVDVLGRTWGTPLGAAIEGRRLPEVKLLCESGADIHLRCGKYNTALEAVAATKDPNLGQILADAEARIERPTLYGEIKWKLESVATRLENLATLHAQNSWPLQIDGQGDLEQLAGACQMLSESLRPLGSLLNPQDEIQASRLKNMLRLMPDILRDFEHVCDLVSVIFDSLKISNLELGRLDLPTLHALTHFNESIVKSIRQSDAHLPFFRQDSNKKSLTEFLLSDSPSILENLEKRIRRASSSPKVQDVSALEAEHLKFGKYLSDKHLHFEKALEDAKVRRVESLAYYDTYPYDPEHYHARMTAGHRLPREPSEHADLLALEPSLTREQLSGLGHTLQIASSQVPQTTRKEVLPPPAIDPETARQARQQLFGSTPVQLNPPTQKQGVIESSRLQTQQPSSPVVTPLPFVADRRTEDEPVIDTEDFTQGLSPLAEESRSKSLGRGGDSEITREGKLSDMDVAKKDGLFKRLREHVSETTNQGHRSVRAIRSFILHFSKQITTSAAGDHDPKSILLNACDTMEVSLTHLHREFDLHLSEIVEYEFREMLSNSTSDEDSTAQMLAHFQDFTPPLNLILKILNDSKSEASSEMSQDQALPEWNVIMEYFEWKAGYSFQECLSDCASFFGGLGSDSSAEPSPSSSHEDDARERLKQMKERLNLFGQYAR